MDRRPSKRTIRAARRRQAAAINVAGLGALLIVLPHLVPGSMVAVFRPMSSIGWLLLVIGVAFIAFQRRSSAEQKPPSTSFPPPRAREPRRPAMPVPLVERVQSAHPPVARRTILDPPLPAVRPRPAAWGPEVFAVIEWRRFEAVVEALFAQAGFLTKAQSHGPDEGVDVWLHSKNQPDGAPVSVVQCKHWGKRVGVDKVRELRGVMAAKGVTRGQFATTASFTPDAAAMSACASAVW